MDFVSDGCFDLCGYHREEIESQAILWGDFTHADDIDEVDRLVRAATVNGESFEVEYRIVAKSGQTRWVWERGRVVHVREDGIAVLEGFITDITSRMQSETALRDAQAYAQAVVESAAEAVITIDRNGRIESFNRAATRMFDYTAAQAAGRGLRELMANDVQHEFHKWLRSEQDLRPRTLSDIEVDGRTRNGLTFPVSLSVNGIDGADDASVIRRFVVLARDLTQRRARDRQIREQRELLAHVDRVNTLGEMAAAIAHEINQPLTAISTHAQSGLRFLRQSPSAVARVEEGLELISAQARRAGAVIERIQMMARREERQPEVIEATVLVRGIQSLAELEARSLGFAIDMELDEDVPAVPCDPVQIQQVILNLLRNGMESMSDAGCGANARILLQAKRVSAGVRIAVIDQGSGLSSHVTEQLFEPFSSSKQLGMGLGLAISRSILVAHDSSLDYFDNPNVGATFRFTLACSPNE